MEEKRAIRRVERSGLEVIRAKVLKAGLIGCGSIAFYQYIPVIAAEIGDLEIAAACDLDRPRLAAIGALYGFGSLYDDYRAVLAHPGLDAVFILVPPKDELVMEIAGMAIKRGLPIFFEKPAAYSSATLVKLAEKAAQKGVPCQVGYNRRYAPAYQLAKRMLDRGRLGALAGLSFRYWFRRFDLSRTVHDVGIHMYDLAVYLGGNPDLSSVATRIFSGRNGDVIGSSFYLEGGVVCHVMLSSTELWDFPNEHLEVIGEQNALIVENCRQVRLYHPLADGLNLSGYEPTYSGYWDSDHYRNGFSGELRAFVDCLKEGRPPQPGLSEAALAISLAEAVQESIGPR